MTKIEKFMKLAIAKAREGVESGQSPFGACIVKNNTVISLSHNTVFHNTDITAHAEIQAIREACRKLDTIDLTGCEIYSTCEPCPMCFSAIHWAKIDKVYFGAEIKDAKSFGFNEINLSNENIKALGGSKVEIIGKILKNECIKLFEYWNSREDKRVY
jgi:tRNA(Arg) A34 adenosine deaminase TadA